VSVPFGPCSLLRASSRRRVGGGLPGFIGHSGDDVQGNTSCERRGEHTGYAAAGLGNASSQVSQSLQVVGT
jgi:hypothetical protein